jgi:hypothetical protein
VNSWRKEQVNSVSCSRELIVSNSVNCFKKQTRQLHTLKFSIKLLKRNIANEIFFNENLKDSCRRHWCACACLCVCVYTCLCTFKLVCVVPRAVIGSQPSLCSFTRRLIGCHIGCYWIRDVTALACVSSRISACIAHCGTQVICNWSTTDRVRPNSNTSELVQPSIYPTEL